MKYKAIPEAFFIQLEQSLHACRKAGQKPIAAFDADGTLWNTDLGENFFRWQIRQKVLSGLPIDPWNHYWTWKDSGDPRPAYLWLAQINSGHSLRQVRSWAQSAVDSISPLDIFPDVSRIIRYLQAEKVSIYIVTASVRWAVEPGAAALGISEDHVLGIETAVRQGEVTDEPAGTITYREGKVKALLAATQGNPPFFSCGNSIGDDALLRCSSHLRLAVSAAPEDSQLFGSEEKLREIAQSQSWLYHRFLP